MRSKQALHVLADRRGRIIGAAFLGVEQTGDVQMQIIPRDGQALVEVDVTTGVGKLESAEDFRRLSGEFHLPRGSSELVRKRARVTRKAKRRR
jgi:hypothetical protein